MKKLISKILFNVFSALVPYSDNKNVMRVLYHIKNAYYQNGALENTFSGLVNCDD